MTNEEYVLVVQLPNQPQTHLIYENEGKAEQALDYALETNIVVCESTFNKVVVHTCPGTVYIIISKQQMERQMMQNQLLQQNQKRGH